MTLLLQSAPRVRHCDQLQGGSDSRPSFLGFAPWVACTHNLERGRPFTIVMVRSPARLINVVGTDSLAWWCCLQG
jgi:hypothetical protein